MAILPIFEVPHPILRQKAAAVAVVDDRVRKLLDDMAETMYAAPGVGLAAPQVGISERILVAAVPVRDGLAEEQEGDDDAGHEAFLLELVNPEIIERKGTIFFDEGCLSVPDLSIEVKRSEEIVVRSLSRDGVSWQFTARGFYSVILQHELDHLDGKTLYDRLSTLKRQLYVKKLRKTRANGIGPGYPVATPTG